MRPPSRFGPDKVSLAPVVLLAFGTIPLASSDSRLALLLVVPLACAVWVLRARVDVTPAGLRVCRGLGTRQVPWDDVEGFDVATRGPVVLRERSGRRTSLAMLPRDRRRAFVDAAAAASAP